MTRVLVLGAGGQLGFELTRATWPEGVSVVAVARPDVDLTHPESVRAAVERVDPGVVVNAAAHTAVDRAEREPDAAFAVNRDGPALLAEICAARDAALIHVSTDYVFDGAKATPYVEDDPVGPINVYGASKEAGERAVRARLERHVILRTSWVHGVHGANFVKTMLRLGRERDEVGVVADQRGAPTAAADLAGVVTRIVGRLAAGAPIPWGTYHFSNTGETTWFAFAERVFRRLEAVEGHRPRSRAIATADYPTPARRPAGSRLDCARIRAALDLDIPTWEDGVDRVLDELLGPDRRT